MLSLDSRRARDRYRMVILQTDGKHVLLVPHGTEFAFPELEIPALERVADHLTEVARRQWQQAIVCLFPMTPEGQQETPHVPQYYVAESLGSEDSSPTSTWVPVKSLGASSFLCASDFEVFCRALDQCSGKRYPQAGPFETLGWLSEIQAWIAAVIEPFRLRLSGSFRQLNASPTFSLIRFATNGRAVWFKAVGEPNLREFPIFRELARFFPKFVPSILAMREDWHAWITLEVPGVHPDENSNFKTWTTVTKTLADLQRASIGSTLHLIDAGCRDARIPALRDLVDPFLHAMEDLMGRQSKATPAPLRAVELHTLARQLKDALATLEQSRVPDTIGHLDFNPGNVVVNQSDCAFLDWAEGCVGHPFLTYQYLLQTFLLAQTKHLSLEGALRSSYAEVFLSLATPSELDQAFSVIPLVAAFAYGAVSDTWRRPAHLLRPRSAASLRSLTRRMKREADLLSSGGRVLPVVASAGVLRMDRALRSPQPA
jgi:Phosphotransferase enzyme family